MDVRLVVEKGSTQTRTLRLRTPETVVGRRRDCDLRIPSAEVSRRHCLLSFREGLLSVEDLGSANGTFLNGEAVTGRQVVRPGDRLEIGPVTFLVQYELSPEARQRLRKKAAPAEVPEVVEAEEDLVEAVPLEEEAMATADEEPIEAVPLEEEPAVARPADESDQVPLAPVEGESEEKRPAEDDAPLAVDFNFDDDTEWRMSDPEKFRDLLSDMDRSEKEKG